MNITRHTNSLLIPALENKSCVAGNHKSKLIHSEGFILLMVATQVQIPTTNYA